MRGWERSPALPDRGCNAKRLPVEGEGGPVQEKTLSSPLISGRGVCPFASPLRRQLCLCVCVCVCECPVAPRPSAQAASGPWPRLVAAQLPTADPQREHRWAASLMRAQQPGAVCPPISPVGLCFGTDVPAAGGHGSALAKATSGLLPQPVSAPPTPHHTCSIHGEPPSKSAFSSVSS